MGHNTRLEVTVNMKTLLLTLLCLLYTRAVEIPPQNDIYRDLPSYASFQLKPEKSPNVPVKLGERRCDNSYDGGIPPCLLRPWLPPYSYSTTEVDNGEYKRRKREDRVWRAVFRRQIRKKFSDIIVYIFQSICLLSLSVSHRSNQE